MSIYKIVQKSNYAIMQSYEADESNQGIESGYYDQTDLFDHVVVPEALEDKFVKAQSDGADGIEIVEDTDAKTAHENKLWAGLRSERDQKLLKTDWTQRSDMVTKSVLTTQQVTDWDTYQGALRDLPGDTADIYDVTWPTPPATPTISGIND